MRRGETDSENKLLKQPGHTTVCPSTTAQLEIMPSHPKSKSEIEKWLSVRISGNVVWPNKKTMVSFEGHDLMLFPSTRDTDASLHIKLHKLSAKQGMTLLNRFLSFLAWCEDAVVENHGGISGHLSPRPIPCHKGNHLSYTDVFPISVKLPDDKRALRAMALFREARSVNSIPLSFLGYFKILNIVWKDKFLNGKNAIVEGIRDTLANIADADAKNRIAQLKQEGVKDIPKHLYESGRCAVAHAFADPIADPDDIEDLHRLSQDLWIIKAIAEHLMEDTIQISRSFLG